MRVLITGSSGQIGTNLGLTLQEEGHEVFGVDKRPNSWTTEIETINQDLSQHYTHFKGGIGNQPYPKDLDAVVHFAAYAKVHELVAHPARAFENATMAFNMAEFCRQQNVPIIFGSTRETYGNIPANIIEESYANFHHAASPYSASKIAGEAMVYAYARCYGIPYIVFRFSNVYGRYDNDLDRMERVIPLFIKRIQAGEPITVYGRDKMLDFTYIDDCIQGVKRGIELLAEGHAVNETINLAFGQGNSLLAMTDYIAEALGKEPNMTIQDSLVGEVTHYIANIGKARAILDYKPTTSLRDGIHKTVAWNLDWWQKQS